MFVGVFAPEADLEQLSTGGGQGVGFGEGYPSPAGEGSAEGTCPLPRKKFEFFTRKGAFW